MWVTDWEGPVRIYSVDGAFKGRVDLGRESHHLAFSADGRQAWVTDNAARRVFVVDTVRLTVIDSIETAGAPHHVAVAGARAAVADGVGGVVIFDLSTRQQVFAAPTGAEPHGVAAPS